MIRRLLAWIDRAAAPTPTRILDPGPWRAHWRASSAPTIEGGAYVVELERTPVRAYSGETGNTSHVWAFRPRYGGTWRSTADGRPLERGAAEAADGAVALHEWPGRPGKRGETA